MARGSTGMWLMKRSSEGLTTACLAVGTEVCLACGCAHIAEEATCKHTPKAAGTAVSPEAGAGHRMVVLTHLQVELLFTTRWEL